MFPRKCVKAIREKGILCTGLDPALPGQRKDNVIPSKYLEHRGPDARLDFCLDIIDQTSEFSAAFKPNQQYIMGFTRKQHQTLTRAIQEHDSISILDYKLNDIGDTVESALFHIHEWGYDAVTFNPLLGNMQASVEIAHSFSPRIGIIVLTLTSNMEAAKYQKEAKLFDKPLFLAIAQDVREFGADGCVVGVTGHIKEEEIRLVRQTVGENKIFLIPGVGAQKGDPEKAKHAGTDNILINVGRAIIYSNNPASSAKEYHGMFEKIRRRSIPRGDPANL